MKKLGLIFVLIFVVSFGVSAQINNSAIGLRLSGGGFGSSAEISYQRKMGASNRLELDLGASSRSSYSGFGLTGIYHWGWPLLDNLHWYAGPGAGIVFFNHKVVDESYMAITIGGQIGLEYDFRSFGVPLQASLDFRPMFSLIGGSNGHGWGSGLGVRYYLK